MKLKIDANGVVAHDQGRPIYIHDDGKEVAFDAAATVQSLQRTLDESKKFKERAMKAEESLKQFEGIEDAEAARKALETLKNVSAGDLVKADKVEEIKREARLAADKQVADAAKASAEEIKRLTAEREGLQSQLYSEKVGGAFSRSKFIVEKIAIPPDMVQSKFGSNFKVEEGKIVGQDAAGNKIYSRARPGELADFDEALETLIDAYPNRDAILKGTNQSGSGARPANGGGGAKAKEISRAEFNKLGPTEQMKAMTVDRIAVVD